MTTDLSDKNFETGSLAYLKWLDDAGQGPTGAAAYDSWATVQPDHQDFMTQGADGHWHIKDPGQIYLAKDTPAGRKAVGGLRAVPQGRGRAVVDATGPLRRVHGRHADQTVTPDNRRGHVRQRQIVASAAIVLVGSLVTACTSGGAPTPPAPTKGMSLAQCRAYGVPSAPVTLKLPGMVLYANVPVAAKPGTTTLVAFNELPDVRSVSSSATVFVGPASSAPDRVQEGIWNANIAEHSDWDVDIVAKGAITVSATGDTAQATHVSHSTFTTHHGSTSATFDYWAFTSSGRRYLLSYARLPTVKTPDAATFFATATSCPKSTPTG